MENVSNNTNQDLSGVTEAESKTKPPGEFTILPFHCLNDLVFVLESPASTKEAFEDIVRNESGNTSQDQSKIGGDRHVSVSLTLSLQRTLKSFYSRQDWSRRKKLCRD